MGVDQGVLTVKGEGVGNVAGGEAGHQGGGGLPAGHAVLGGNAQDDVLLPVVGAGHSHLFVPVVHGGQEGLRVGQNGLVAVDHVELAGGGIKGQGLEAPDLGADGQRIPQLAGGSVLRVKALHQGFHLGEAELDGGGEVLGDLFAHADDENFRIQEIIRPAEYIPENMGVYNALELLKQSSVKCGIVIDEFGSVEGIVTLKDMIKGLLGNMPEAGEEDMIIQRQDGSYFVDGQCPFYDFLEYFDIENLYTDYNYNTLGGLIFGILQHVRTGERFCWLSFEMEIADMDGARIDKVVVRKNGPCD